MLKFQNQKMLLIISSFVGMGLANNLLADNLTSNSDAKVVFNSLESFQVNCFANEGAVVLEPDPEFTVDKIINLAASGNPEERISALSHLAEKRPIDAGIVQKILQAAILDKDSNVRGQAVYAIAKQACEDLPLVLEQAMQDSELSVRLMAVDSLGTDDRSIVLLKQAKEDEEEAIRDLAGMKLEALSATSKTQGGGI
ncbi:MAG: HEAT repeat domain-containing protein [Nitrosomonas sp.]|nr:HEAT repeat domain-containing protein [Nitrosomonas sp.]